MTDRSTPALPEQADYAAVHTDIVELLESARRAAARSVNALMTASYWEIGRRIVEFEQRGQDRAEYGSALLKRLSADLTVRFGRGFGIYNLQQMRLFYQAWPAEKIYWTLSNKSSAPQIWQTPSGESSGAPIPETLSRNAIDLPTLAQAFPLPWSAYVRLLSVKNEHARAFYENETLRCGWSVRQLGRQIGSQFYERIALSRNKAAMLLTRHSREGGNPRIDSGERRSEGSETACRLYPRQSAQRHPVHWRDIGSDKTDMGTQERCSRGFHSKVWRSHAGLLRTARIHGGSHDTRKATQKVESRMETQAYRRTQSGLARSMAGNRGPDGWIDSTATLFTPAPGFVTPAQAGVQKAATEPRTLDSRLRGNDGIFERLRSELEARRIARGGNVESGE